MFQHQVSFELRFGPCFNVSSFVLNVTSSTSHLNFRRMDQPQSPRNLVSSLISSISTQPTSTNIAQTSNPLKGAPPHIQKALLTLHVLFPNELLPALDLLDRGLVARLTASAPQNEAQQRQNSNPQSRLPLHQEAHEQPRRTDQREERPGWPELGGHRLRQPSRLGLPGLPPLQQPQAKDQTQPPHPENHDPLSSPHRQDPRGHQHQSQDLERQDQDLHLQPSAAEVGAQQSGVLATRPLAQAFDASRGREHVTQGYVVRSGQQARRDQMRVSHTPCYEVRLDAWSCSCPAFAFAAFPASGSETLQNNDAALTRTHDSESSEWSFGGLTQGTDMPVCKHLLACVLVEHCSIFASFVEHKEVSIEELAGWAAGWGD